MKARIIITPDGTLQAYIDEGSFDDGKVKLARLIAELTDLGIAFEFVGEPEQHKHDIEHAHLHATGENHNH